jgi:predicted transcriptional regulator
MAPEPAPALPPAVGGAEGEVMDVLWDLGEASVRDVMDRLNATARSRSRPS